MTLFTRNKMLKNARNRKEDIRRQELLDHLSAFMASKMHLNHAKALNNAKETVLSRINIILLLSANPMIIHSAVTPQFKALNKTKQ